MNYLDLSKEDLEVIFKDVGFKTKPNRHQYITLLWGLEKNRIAINHGIGTGKTLNSLYMHQLWKTRKVLVVCPNGVVNSWVKQITLHTESPLYVLKGTAIQRKKILETGEEGFYIINYEGLKPLFMEKFEDRNGKVKTVIDTEAIKHANFDGLIIDESHNCKNKAAIQSQLCAAVSSYCKKVIIMTGTPVCNNEMDLWSQYYVLDNGATLGDNYWYFLNNYFYKKPWDKFNWYIKPTSQKKILEKIKNVTIRFSREECLDLPEIAYQLINVDITPEQTRFLSDVLSELKTEIQSDIFKTSIKGNNEESTVTMLTKTSKLVQIPSGFCYDKNGNVIKIKSNKLNELEELLLQIERKVIIWHEFNEEADMINTLCRKLKIKCVEMSGRVDDKHKKHNIDLFIKNDEYKVLIAHPKTAGTGLDGLQDVCDVMIFFTNGWSSVVREQCIGRISRQGQKKRGLVIDLVVKDTIEEKKMGVLEHKEDLRNTILDYIKNYKK